MPTLAGGPASEQLLCLHVNSEHNVLLYTWEQLLCLLVSSPSNLLIEAGNTPRTTAFPPGVLPSALHSPWL
jgi:hypothetical protein